MQLDTIAKPHQADVIASFWAMMRELESQADNEKDAVLHVQVEGYYRLWNRMTGDNKQPIWLTRSQ